MKRERAATMRRVLPWWYRALCEARWRVTPPHVWARRAARHRWVFVTGMNRSGKTTLSTLLAHHPLISVVPNASSMSSALPNALTEGCPHVWTERLHRFRLTEADLGRVDPSRLIFDWLSFHGQPRRVLVVESDLAAVQMRWLQGVFPDSRFIALVRNGYAVAEGIRLKEGYALERCARQWELANEILLRDAPQVRSFRAVAYEELVERPQPVVEQIADVAGVDPAPLWPVLRSGWRLGNTDRRLSALRNANHDLIGRLSPSEVDEVTRVAAPMLAHFGYRPPPTWTTREEGA